MNNTSSSKQIPTLPYSHPALIEPTVGDKNGSIVECVKLTHNQFIVVTTDKVLVYRPQAANNITLLPQLPQALVTKSQKSVARTKKLLDTAIVLGKRAALAPKAKRKLPALNLTYWIWSLIAQYHLTHPTPRLMREAAQRFQAQGRQQLAEWATEKAQEETGHDRLALRDIRSLGYQAEAVVQAFIPSSAQRLVDYFIGSVQTPDPIKSVGYAYTLERIALAVTEKHIQAIEKIIPPGINATRCLRVHSSIGSDVEHVDEALEVIAQLSTAERQQIASACYETAKLYFTVRQDDYPPIAELQQKLNLFQS